MKKVLIVDDDIDFTHMLKMTLQLTRQYQVRVANQSTQAMQMAREFKPDLILLDGMMPGLDGGEVAGLIQADPEICNTPFIFLTVAVSKREEITTDCYKGKQIFLPKPLHLSELIDCIEEKIHAHESTEATTLHLQGVPLVWC